jgi:cell division initiation protein
MKVSPLDLRQQRFRIAVRGFDKVEVTSFLMAAADDYEQALREADRLRQDISRMEAALNEHREHEKALKSTLMAAQKLADDIKANADEEARRIVSEAEVRSQKTQARLDGTQREIEGLRLKRKDVETSLSGTIQTLRNALDYIREQDAREKDEPTVLRRPHQSGATAAATAADHQLQGLSS